MFKLATIFVTLWALFAMLLPFPFERAIISCSPRCSSEQIIRWEMAGGYHMSIEKLMPNPWEIKESHMNKYSLVSYGGLGLYLIISGLLAVLGTKLTLKSLGNKKVQSILNRYTAGYFERLMHITPDQAGRIMAMIVILQAILFVSYLTILYFTYPLHTLIFIERLLMALFFAGYACSAGILTLTFRSAQIQRIRFMSPVIAFTLGLLIVLAILHVNIIDTVRELSLQRNF